MSNDPLLTDADLARLSAIRATRPTAVLEAAANRRRRDLLPPDGRLMLVAADHPARGSIAVSGKPTAMADREELLRRLMIALSRPAVDGVLGTADILEDLLLLGALDDKIAIGSMNRGGLAGATFEMDDRFTGCTADHLGRMRFDGGKMLVRIDYDDPATVSTLESAAGAVGELAEHGLMAMVEPFITRHEDGRRKNDLTTEAVIRSVAIASGLGPTSRHTWLKLPVVEGMEQVTAATTTPVLLLGGDPTGPPEEYRAAWAETLALPGVRGLVVGRALLYPPDGDVGAAVDIATQMVHPSSET